MCVPRVSTARLATLSRALTSLSCLVLSDTILPSIPAFFYTKWERKTLDKIIYFLSNRYSTHIIYASTGDLLLIYIFYWYMNIAAQPLLFPVQLLPSALLIPLACRPTSPASSRYTASSGHCPASISCFICHLLILVYSVRGPASPASCPASCSDSSLFWLITASTARCSA